MDFVQHPILCGPSAHTNNIRIYGIEAGDEMAELRTDCFWLAAVILALSGFGRQYWKLPLKAYIMTMLGAVMVVVLGMVWNAVPIADGTVNAGLLWLGLMTLVWSIWCGGLRWWYRWLSLAMVFTLIRMVAPLISYQAVRFTPLVPESLGLGLASGLVTEDPVSSLGVALGADILSSGWVAAVRGGHWSLGSHDLTSALLAGLCSWAIGWVRIQWSSRRGPA